MLNSLEVHSVPASTAFIIQLKSTGSKIYPWGTPLVTDHQPDAAHFTATLGT